jgi:hypothetical protein
MADGSRKEGRAQSLPVILSGCDDYAEQKICHLPPDGILIFRLFSL